MNTSLIFQIPDKVRLHTAGIMLLFITACTLFKEKSFYRADSLQRQSSSLELKQELHSHSIRISNRMDSSSAEFYTEIFPRGRFSYSPTGGFTGEAEVLRVRGKTGSLQKVQESAVRDSAVKLSSEFRKKLKSEVRTVVKEKDLKKKIPDWVWVLGMVILVFLGIIYSMKRLGTPFSGG